MKMGSGKWKVVVLVCISIALHFPLSSFHSAQGQVRVNPGSFDNGIRNTNRSSGSNRNNASTSTTNQFPNDSTQSQADTSATKGLEFHEEPWVGYNTLPGTEMLLVPGFMFTIEPMINMGTWKVFIDADDPYGWEVITADELPSAQWEHTLLMTEHGVEILTY